MRKTEKAMFIRCILAALLTLLANVQSAVSAFATAPEVGRTIVVKNEVTIEAGDERHPLEKGAIVHQNEAVLTSKSASAEIELLDKTKLAVGPDAKIVLDKLIFDPGAAAGSISVNLSKGAFRFVTGVSPKASYEIKTPTATMGVHGTVFDVYVAGNGETVVLLHEGSVDVCATPSRCQRHDKVGRMVHVNLAGVLSAPLRWDGNIIKGIGVVTAFPFLGKKLMIDPVRRLGHAALLTGAVGDAVTAPVNSMGRILGGSRLPF
jgi:FecR protein